MGKVGGDASAAPAASTVKAPAVDADAIDRAVAPCDDFYAFACGSWMKKTPIPEDQATWMRSFSVINEQNQIVLAREVDETLQNVA